jgi:ribose-phosphate pyrophosphokinase
LPDALLFALGASRPFAERIAAHLGTTLAPHEEREFEDGEHKARPLLCVRGQDCYVYHNLYGEPGTSANDKLCRLLFFCATLKQNGAGRVTAVAPYLAYARKDRQTKPRDPVTSRYVAQLFEAVGIDRMIVLDVHNLAAFQNAFRIEAISLTARPLFLRHLLPRLAGAEVAVVSPDAGGAKRAEAFRELLERHLHRPVPLAFLEKKRSSGVVSGDAVVGEVEGRLAVVIDDIVASGTTMARAAEALRRQGAVAIVGCVTHGLFTAGSQAMLESGAFAAFLVTDTIPPFRLPSEVVRKRLSLVETAPLFAEAIRRLQLGLPLTPLAAEGPWASTVA